MHYRVVKGSWTIREGEDFQAGEIVEADQWVHDTSARENRSVVLDAEDEVRRTAE